MSEPTRRFLELLDNVKSGSTGWTSRCPAHEDRENSLSIDEGKDGRTLVKCFAGCPTTAIIESVGLTPVSSVSEFDEAAEEFSLEEGILLLIRTRDRTGYRDVFIVLKDR